MPKTTAATGFLFVLTMGSVAFLSGYKPTVFLTTVGWTLLMLAIASPFLFLLSLRTDDRLSWKVSLTIVGILMATLIILFFTPAWYFFQYVPRISNPLYVQP